MTEIRINNGASVSRIYGDSSATEFLACFQYDGDAKDFAEKKLADDAARGWLEGSYAVSSHSDGRLTIIRHKSAPQAVAA